LEGNSAFRETGDPKRPTGFGVGEPRYEGVEVMKPSSSETTVLIVGDGPERFEIIVNDFILVFGTLTSNISSQPDLNSKVEGRVFEFFEMLIIFFSRPKLRQMKRKNALHRQDILLQVPTSGLFSDPFENVPGLFTKTEGQ
jgi:hypothetical protein